LPGIQRTLETVRASAVRVIDLAHGQKKSRIVAWRFTPPV
jgi:23S rRNA A1618 N6-methylase RlmF